MLVRILPLLLLTTTAAHAGTRLESVSWDLSGGDTMTVSTWAQGGMMRVEMQPGESTMIFRDDTIYAISHKDKSYVAMDRATMKRVAEQVNPALKMLQEQMKNMAPEQRAQMEKMLGARLPGTAEQAQQIKRTSRSDKINGYSCTYVEVHEGGELIDELCIASSGTIKGSEELINAARLMSAAVQDMMSVMDAPWLKEMAQKQMQNFDALGGIPVFSRNFADGKPRRETTLTRVSSESIAPAQFEVPAGYTRKDMMAPR
jgi:hypothetical protein